MICKFNKNSVTHQGGAIYSSQEAKIGRGALFLENRAGWYGGAIYGYGITIGENATFTNNLAERYSGGAIYCSGNILIEKDVTFCRSCHI